MKAAMWIQTFIQIKYGYPMQTKYTKGGIHTLTEDGSGQVGAGPGCRIIPGAGDRTTMADGGTQMYTDGSGHLEESGVHHGLTGATMVSMLGGILHRRETTGEITG